MARAARRGLAASPCPRSTSAPRRSTWRAWRSRRRPPSDVAAVILELARSEQTYTFQRPIDYSTSVLAGAIAAGWQGPVFIQGDHYQFNAKKYATDPEAMTEEIRRACRLAIDAGYRNIDIDASTLVDLSLDGEDEQQRANYERTAELVALIRSLEPDGVTISVGGEIGEVGKSNSTEGELRAYLDGLRRELGAASAGASSASARSACRPARRTAAWCMPDGSVGMVAVDFEVHRRLGEIARREYGLAGTVQHGASTLPDELFHRFRDVETAEIHLATGFQNLLYEHPAFPGELHEEIEPVVLRQRARRAQVRSDRPAVRVHDAEEGARAVQAPALGPRDEGRRSSPTRRRRSVPVPRARRRREPRDGRSLRAARRVAPAGSRRALGGRPRRLSCFAGTRSARIALIRVSGTPMLRARSG